MVDNPDKGQDTKVGITQTIEYSDIKKIWGDKYPKKQFETVQAVRERFRQLALYRRTSCYWSTPIMTPFQYDNVSTEGVNTIDTALNYTGTNWNFHWDLCLKAWAMWKQYLNQYSNVKSPISFATVEAIMAEFQDNNNTMSLYPTHDEDRNNVKVYTAFFKYLESQLEISTAKKSSFHTTVQLGTSFLYNPYVEKIHKKEKILSGDDAQEHINSIDDKEHPDLKQKLLDLLENGKPITKEEDIIDYKNPAIIAISPYDIYPDDSASCLQGLSREASDLVYRTTPSIEQFRARFINSKDPWVIMNNVKRVKPAYQAASIYSEVQKFFKIPQDIITSRNKIELIEYYNKVTDRYIIVANDLLVREGPLPYNHGQLPFSVSKFTVFEDQFYGIGIPAVLESLQALDETILNMYIETKKISLNPSIIYNSAYEEDLDGLAVLEPGKRVAFGGPVTEDNLRFFQGPDSPIQDISSLREMIKEDATMAAGVNDLAYANSDPNEAVRNNQIAMQSTYKIIKKGINNWSEGLHNSWSQIIDLIQQYLPNEFIEANEDVDDEKKGGKIYRTIPTDGFKLEMDDQSGDLQQKTITGRSFFEMKPETLTLLSKPDIKIEVDQILPLSANTAIQRSEVSLSQLVPILGNPMFMNNPIIVDIVRDYMQQHGYDSSTIDKLQDEDSEDAVEEATLQDNQMMKGNRVPGMPGMSDAHKNVHLVDLLDLKDEILEKQRKLNVPASSMTPEKLQKMQGDIQDLQNNYSLLYEHLMTDNQPKVGGVNQNLGQGSTPMPPEGNQPPTAPPGLQGPGMPPMPPPQSGAGAPPQGVPMPPMMNQGAM